MTDVTNATRERTRISIFLPTLNGGGAERVLLDLAAEFVERGHAVDLVLMSKRPEEPLMALVPRAVTIVDLQCRRLWTSIPAMSRYLRSARPTAVLAAMPLANAVAVYARGLARVSSRLILTEHNARSLAFGDCEQARYLVLVPFVRLSYRFADCIVGVSQGVVDRLCAVPGVSGDRVRVIYNPTYHRRIGELAGAPSPHPWLEDLSVPVILGSGRLELQKDFATLLRAFALIRKSRCTRLMILGEGSQLSALEALAKSLGIDAHVRFEGFVPNPWAYVARARVFALSSIHEGLPGVLIEAMACGTPVVSTDCPSGPSEILEAGSYGALVPACDPAALAGAIESALDRPIGGEVLQRRARFFSMENATAGYLSAMGLTS